MNQTTRKRRPIFTESEQDVIEGAACTWCGAAVGEVCRTTRSRLDLPGSHGTAHAARWYDFWNATHPDDPIPVNMSEWRRRA